MQVSHKMDNSEDLNYTELLLKSVDRDKVIGLVGYITNKNTAGDTVEEYFENLSIDIGIDNLIKQSDSIDLSS